MRALSPDGGYWVFPAPRVSRTITGMHAHEAPTRRSFTSYPRRRNLRRLLLLWQMPVRRGRGKDRAHEETTALAERDVSRLLEAEGIAAAELIRLERAGDLHPLWYDWMLVVHVMDAPESQRPLDQLYEDLRSANARPILLRDAESQSLE
jgi:hypothetical protein